VRNYTFGFPGKPCCLETIGSKSTYEWPRMATNDTAKKRDHEWPRMTTNDDEWPQLTTSDHEWPRVRLHQKMSVVLWRRHCDVVARSFHHDNNICTKLKLFTGVVTKDCSSGCAFMIPLFSSFANSGCWVYVLSGSSCYLFHLWKRRNIRAVLSNEVSLETSGADYVCIFWTPSYKTFMLSYL